MIEVAALSRRFGGFALSDINLRVEKGAYTVVLGPSGCGKSVFLGTLAGLYRPDTGTISLKGRDVTRLPPEERKVGVVFQEPSLFPHFDVAGNIAYGLRVTAVPATERRARVAKLADVLRLESVLGRPTASLSGGEAQKVVLARALAAEPEVLLLDEPLSQLDHNTRINMQQELRRVHDRLGLTTLHVTHSREEARALGDFCAVMLGGRIVQAGARDRVHDAPACTFVARFLGLEAPGDIPPPPGCSEVCLGGTGQCDRDGGE
jgi:ABC-type sugar transport system ATPase subunit